MRWKWIALGIAVLWFGCAERHAPPPPELPVLMKAPEFAGLTAEEQPFHSHQLQGKVVVVSFFFTSCTGPCPVMNSRLSVLQAQFANEPDVRFVSITVDPERDTPERLRAYAQRYGAKPERWIFLRMTPDSVEWLATKGFRVPGSATQPDLHSTRYILLDRQGNVRGYFSALDEQQVQQLEQALRQLLHESNQATQ